MTYNPEVNEVHIDVGDDMSKMFHRAAELTYDLLPPGMVVTRGKGFRSFRGVSGGYFASQIDKLDFSSNSDGVGTKIEIHERMGSHLGAPINGGAMVFDDALKSGGQAYGWTDVLDVNVFRNADGSDIPEVNKGMRELAQGLFNASIEAGVVLLGGETAELGSRVQGYGPFNYNLSATANVVVHRERAIGPEKLQAGDIIVGLQEPGMRSNGITNLRNTFRSVYGPEWHNVVEPTLDERRTIGEVAILPSVIYHGLVIEMTGGSNMDVKPQIDMHGFVHITGGGWRKISSTIFGTELSATIDNPMDPPKIMSLLQKLGNVSDEKALGIWHWGQGGAIIVNENDVQTIIDTAARRNIHAQPIGYLSKESTPRITIVSRGEQQPGRVFTFPVQE